MYRMGADGQEWKEGEDLCVGLVWLHIETSRLLLLLYNHDIGSTSFFYTLRSVSIASVD